MSENTITCNCPLAPETDWITYNGFIEPASMYGEPNPHCPEHAEHFDEAMERVGPHGFVKVLIFDEDDHLGGMIFPLDAAEAPIEDVAGWPFWAKDADEIEEFFAASHEWDYLGDWESAGHEGTADAHKIATSQRMISASAFERFLVQTRDQAPDLDLQAEHPIPISALETIESQNRADHLDRLRSEQRVAAAIWTGVLAAGALLYLAARTRA